MNKDEIQAIRRAAFREAMEIAATSKTYHNNGTGHWKAGWHGARKDIIELIEKHMEEDAARLAEMAAVA